MTYYGSTEQRLDAMQRDLDSAHGRILRMDGQLTAAIEALRAINNNGCGDAAEKCAACMAADALNAIDWQGIPVSPNHT